SWSVLSGLRRALVSRIIQRKTASHFCWKCFVFPHCPTQNRFALLLEMLCSTALSNAKPLRTFAGNALNFLRNPTSLPELPLRLAPIKLNRVCGQTIVGVLARHNCQSSRQDSRQPAAPVPPHPASRSPTATLAACARDRRNRHQKGPVI